MTFTLFCSGVHVTLGYLFSTFLNASTTPLVTPHQVESIILLLKMRQTVFPYIVTEEKDLGVVFDKNLKFTSHVNQIVLKAWPIEC